MCVRPTRPGAAGWPVPAWLRTEHLHIRRRRTLNVWVLRERPNIQLRSSNRIFGEPSCLSGTLFLQSPEWKTKRCDAEKPKMENYGWKREQRKLLQPLVEGGGVLEAIWSWRNHRGEAEQVWLQTSPQLHPSSSLLSPSLSSSLCKPRPFPPGQRSVTLFSRAAAICCRRSVSCLFWAAGSSSRDWMIWGGEQDAFGSG